MHPDASSLKPMPTSAENDVSPPAFVTGFPAAIAVLVLLDVLFLRWVWIHFENWGFWDWDYQQSLLEATRVAFLEYGQLPLWNPYLGGGVPLAGNSLNHAWAPCILFVLCFGTIAGIKLCIAFYLALTQWGMYQLARARNLGREAALFSAAIFSLGGVYAQRLTHGHFEWIAIAWMPLILVSLHRFLKRGRPGALVPGSLAFAFLFLDGGPYQFVFFSLFAGCYALCLSATQRSLRPALALPSIAVVGAGLAAIKLLPVLEVSTRYPRKTYPVNFYGAPFTPTGGEILHQMFTSRAQAHDPSLWMPYVLNVGAYVGVLVLLFVLYALVRDARRQLPWLGLGLAFLWIALGPAAPIDLWQILHELPFFSALRVPARFNVYVLLLIALIAGRGLETALRDATDRLASTRARRAARVLALGLAVGACLDLAVVNGESFRVAFSIPPLETNPPSTFAHYTRSPHMPVYKNEALYPTHPNWRSAAYPAILENRGVLRTYRTIASATAALSPSRRGYRGEVYPSAPEGPKVLDYTFTPNRLTSVIDGAGGTLVFNLNFDPGWQNAADSEANAPYSASGNLAVDVAPGTESVVLVYRPAAFVRGAFTSASFLIGGALLLGFSRAGRGRT